MAIIEGDAVTGRDQRTSGAGLGVGGEPVSARRLALNNAWYRRRAPHCAAIGSSDLLVSAHAGARPEQNGPVVGITVKIDADQGQLIAPLALLRAVLATSNVPLGSRLAQAGILLALECAVAGLLDEIETRIGSRIELTALQDEPPNVQSHQLGARCSFGGETYDIRLTLPDTDMLSRLLSSLRMTGTDGASVSMPIEVAFRVGTADLAASDLKALSPGDVVVFDTSQLGLGQVAAIFGERLIGFVEHEGAIARLTTDVVSIDDHALAGWNATARDDDTVRSLDTGLTRLSFEWGRLTLSTRQLASVTIGHGFDLGCDPGAQVQIRIGSSHVGYGEIVQTAELAGARIVRLFGRKEMA